MEKCKRATHLRKRRHFSDLIGYWFGDTLSDSKVRRTFSPYFLSGYNYGIKAMSFRLESAVFWRMKCRNLLTHFIPVARFRHSAPQTTRGYGRNDTPPNFERIQFFLPFPYQLLLQNGVVKILIKTKKNQDIYPIVYQDEQFCSDYTARIKA